MYEMTEEERQEMLIRQENEQYLADIKDTFGTPHGKRVYIRLLEQACVNAELSNDITLLPAQSAVRNFGVMNLVAPVLAADPEIYTSIITDRINKLKKQEEEDNARS